MTGFPRFPHARCGRIGCPLYPGTSGARTGRRYRQPAASRLPAAWVLLPRPCRHLSGDAHNEASTRVQAIHPPGLPLARRPGMTPGPLRLFPRAPHPREQDPRTHARAGTGYWTLARNYAADLQRSTLQSASSLKRVRPRVAQSACAFPTTSSAAFVRASSFASFSFSRRSRSFSVSAGSRAGRPGLLSGMASRAAASRARRHSEMLEEYIPSRRSSAARSRGLSAFSYSSRTRSLYSAVKVRRLGRPARGPSEAATVPSCPVRPAITSAIDIVTSG